MTQKRRASSAGRISLHSGKTGFAARPAFHGAHGPAPWRGSPRSAVLALPAAAKGPGKEGARPQNSPLPLAAFPLPPSASVPLIQPAPQPTAPVEQKPQKSHPNPLAAPPPPQPSTYCIFPLAPGWAKYNRWEPSGLLPGNPSCGFH